MTQAPSGPGDLELLAANSTCAVQVLDRTMRIRDLSIAEPTVVAYLRNIAPEKQAIALLHILNVGMTELVARRERFQLHRAS